MAQVARALDDGRPWSFPTTRSGESPTVCPLCGSMSCEVRLTTNAVSLVECAACIGRGTSFWVTAQAGERAGRLRSDGCVIDAERARDLLAVRVDAGDPAYIRQSDLDDLVG